MFPLFETLAIIHGKIQNIHYHQQRYEYAMKHYFNATPRLHFSEIIQVPDAFKTGLVRCRIDYNETDFNIAFFPYSPRVIQRLKCVFTEHLDYQFKYTLRDKLDRLKPSNVDEVIIINNGFVSDCTIGNLLFQKAGKWFAPMHYLLKGTQLTALLEKKQVVLTEIRAEDLKDYERVMMINALNPFNLTRALPIQCIST